jgi:hypothetical protein
VQRTAISNTSIISNEDNAVTFRYKCSADGQRKTMTLPAHEFLRRFLQHVPPRGFHRVRAFGLLHPRHRLELRQLQLLLRAKIPDRPGEISTASSAKTRTCRHCHAGVLCIVRKLSKSECEAFERRLETPLLPSMARAPPLIVCAQKTVA